jgi:cell division transport system ATP-binding protein
MIELYGVSKRYPGGQLALEEVSFELRAGEFVFLTGPSGAGKTTLLRLIYREDAPTAGQILVNGRSLANLPPSKIPYLRRSLGIVFQDFRLISRKTVLENVSYLPRVLGAGREEQRRLAREALDRVGLAHRLSAFPKELSGGEQQRVAVARALINQPDILLADEPTGNLDPELSVEVFRLFLELRGRGTTVLVATHDRGLIERFGGRLLVLEGGRLTGDCCLPGPGLEPPDALPAEKAPGPLEVRSELEAIEPDPDRAPGRSASSP